MLRQFYLQRQRAELPAFLRVLKAIPKDQLSYRPHERSPSTEQLVWTLASELQPCLDAVKDNQAEWKQSPAPPLEEMLTLFESRFHELSERVSKMDDASWERKAQFFHKGKVVSEQPVGIFLWSILFDAIHHRGQLAAYLRPMGGRVPSIYGPSADEKSG